MGFPVYAALAQAANTTVHDADEHTNMLMLGNAMHVPVLTSITCVILACVELL